MIATNSDEQKALRTITQGRAGQVFLDFLKRRKQDHVTAWLANLDDKTGAHLRGKASEINELIQLFESLSQSKE